MKATAVSLLALFETKMQLEVPLFQRQYISLLPISQQFHDVVAWDENAIMRRSDALFARALKVWPRW